MVRTGTIQFYLGPAGSGAQPHWHGSAWNWLVHGRKQWELWPPSEATYFLRKPVAADVSRSWEALSYRSEPWVLSACL